MIILENRLKEAFNTLPNLGATETTPLGFKPYFDWGNQYHLAKTYLLKKQELYPLIYLTSSRKTQNSRENTVTSNISLVLAVQNVKTDQLNKDRWAGSTYNDILHPLVRNIETLFTKGSIFLWNGQYTIDEVPNYGRDSQPKDTKAEIPDIWDAILFETEITIYGSERCLKQFKY